jgi:hypothetical protein
VHARARQNTRDTLNDTLLSWHTHVQVDSLMAAAAAAVVDLSGQLLRGKDQLQKHAWQGQLQGVLQEQLERLRAWAAAQVCAASSLRHALQISRALWRV